MRFTVSPVECVSGLQSPHGQECKQCPMQNSCLPACMIDAGNTDELKLAQQNSFVIHIETNESVCALDLLRIDARTLLLSLDLGNSHQDPINLMAECAC
jgi:hypothetical protein